MSSMRELQAGTALEATGTDPHSQYAQHLMDAAGNMPGMITSTGRSVFATRQTIMYGGFRDGMTVGRRHRFFDPRTMFRMPSTDIAMGQGGYSPYQMSDAFNWVADQATKRWNVSTKLANKWGLDAEDVNPIAKRAGKFKWGRGKGYIPEAAEGEAKSRIAWSEAGLLGKQSAVSKMNQIQLSGNLMSHKINPARIESMVSAKNAKLGRILVNQSGAGTAEAGLLHGEAFGLASESIAGRWLTGAKMGERMISQTAAGNMTKETANVGLSAISASKGKAAKRGMGFVLNHEAELVKYGEGKTGIRRVFTAGKNIYKEAAEKTVVKGAEKAAARAGEKAIVGAAEKSLVKKGLAKVGSKLAVGAAEKGGAKVLAGFAGRTAARVALAQADGILPVMDAIMLAWTVYDAGKIVMDLSKMAGQAVVDTTKAAAKSFKGSIDKPLLGSGSYVDTEIAATSRARGVQAIQNSRLNARSALGSEASAMHAHFG